MEKSKLAVIQDDITAVKHALANNISFEGLKGVQLNTILSTLFAQRAAATLEEEEEEAERSSNNNNSSSGSGSSGNTNSNGNGGSNMSRVPVNGARPKAAASKKTATKSPKTVAKSPKTSSSSPSSSSKKKAAPKTPPLKKPKGKSPQPQPKPVSSPPPREEEEEQQEQEEEQQSSSRKSAKKPRTTGSNDRLRQLRKSIKMGDVLSVLMDVSVGGTWKLLWVRGEVVREVSEILSI